MIRILQCVPEEQFSLVDYVKGGCAVNFVTAIDFSSSNGEIDEESSLHCISESKVSYILHKKNFICVMYIFFGMFP